VFAVKDIVLFDFIIDAPVENNPSKEIAWKTISNLGNSNKKFLPLLKH